MLVAVFVVLIDGGAAVLVVVLVEPGTSVVDESADALTLRIELTHHVRVTVLS